MLSVVAWQVQALVDEETASTIEAEAAGLAEQYAQGGIRQLGVVIDERSREPGSSLYLLTDFSGEPLAGNVARLPQGVLDRPGFVETPYETVDEAITDRRGPGQDISAARRLSAAGRPRPARSRAHRRRHGARPGDLADFSDRARRALAACSSRAASCTASTR